MNLHSSNFAREFTRDDAKEALGLLRDWVQSAAAEEVETLVTFPIEAVFRREFGGCHRHYCGEERNKLIHSLWKGIKSCSKRQEG